MSRRPSNRDRALRKQGAKGRTQSDLGAAYSSARGRRSLASGKVRATIFAPDDHLDRLVSWDQLIGTKPEQVVDNPLIRSRQESGPFPARLNCRVVILRQIGRSDLILSTAIQRWPAWSEQRFGPDRWIPDRSFPSIAVAERCPATAANFKPPPPLRGHRNRRDPESARQGSNAAACGCRTQNTHRSSCVPPTHCHRHAGRPLHT